MCPEFFHFRFGEDLNSRLNHELTRATSHVENSRCSFYPKIESQRKKLCRKGGRASVNNLWMNCMICMLIRWCISYFHCISLFRASTIIGALDSQIPIAWTLTEHITWRFARMYFSNIRSHVGKGGRFRVPRVNWIRDSIREFVTPDPTSSSLKGWIIHALMQGATGFSQCRKRRDAKW